MADHQTTTPMEECIPTSHYVHPVRSPATNASYGLWAYPRTPQQHPSTSDARTNQLKGVVGLDNWNARWNADQNLKHSLDLRGDLSSKVQVPCPWQWLCKWRRLQSSHATRDDSGCPWNVCSICAFCSPTDHPCSYGSSSIDVRFKCHLRHSSHFVVVLWYLVGWHYKPLVCNGCGYHSLVCSDFSVKLYPATSVGSLMLSTWILTDWCVPASHIWYTSDNHPTGHVVSSADELLRLFDVFSSIIHDWHLAPNRYTCLRRRWKIFRSESARSRD